MEGQTVYDALQSDEVLRGLPTCDVYSVEDLDALVRKRHLDKPMALVVNTDPSPDGPGEHWVALYIDKESAEYFDSFGDIPRRVAFYRLLNHVGLKWKRNERCLQDLWSSTCGHYCLYYLLLRSRGVPLQKIVQSFGADSLKNDTFVETFTRQYFNLPPIQE